MNTFPRVFFVPFFAIAVFSLSTVIGEEQTQFFALENFEFEQSLVELYQSKKFVSVKNYPQLRRIAARRLAVDYRSTIARHWDEATVQWMENHQEFLENFLTALNRRQDDIPEALKIIKQLCTEHPEKVEKYPDLAIAIAVVWDQPDSEVFSDSRGHYHATEPPDQLGAVDNFLYYSDESAPFNQRIRSLPWEFLTFVVCNRTSLEQRRWIWKTYGNKKSMIGNSYQDPFYVPRWDLKDPAPGERYSDALLNRQYTPSNILKYGTVCSGQTDYALSVCRTMGVPAFMGIGWPKYSGGHYWVQWFEIRDISPKTKSVTFTLEQSGRDEHRKDRIAHSPSPNLGQRENDGLYLLRLVRLGKNATAYRHGELAMQCYQTIVKKSDLSAKQQLDLLNQIDAICPGNLEAWKEIAALSQNKPFHKDFAAQVVRLHPKMVNELLFSPSFLPELTSNMLDFDEIKKSEKKLYQNMFARLEKIDRPDLIFESARHYADSLVKQRRFEEAFRLIASVSLRYCEEANNIEPVLDLLDEIAKRDPKNISDARIADFYAQFLAKITQNGVDVPNSYRMDMLKRGLSLFEITKHPEYANRTKSMMRKVETDIKNFEQGLKEHVQGIKTKYEAMQKP